MAIMNILFLCGDRLETSESDVFRRQILPSKVDPRSEGVNYIFLENIFLFWPFMVYNMKEIHIKSLTLTSVSTKPQTTDALIFCQQIIMIITLLFIKSRGIPGCQIFFHRLTTAPPAMYSFL